MGHEFLFQHRISTCLVKARLSAEEKTPGVYIFDVEARCGRKPAISLLQLWRFLRKIGAVNVTNLLEF